MNYTEKIIKSSSNYYNKNLKEHNTIYVECFTPLEVIKVLEKLNITTSMDSDKQWDEHSYLVVVSSTNVSTIGCIILKSNKLLGKHTIVTFEEYMK